MGPSLLLLMLPESPYPPRCGNALRDVQQIALLRKMGFAVRLVLAQRRRDLQGPDAAFVPAGVEVTYVSHSAAYRESLSRMLWRKTGYLFWSRRHAFAWWAAESRPTEFLAAEIERERPFAVVMRSIFMDGIADIRSNYDGPIIVDCHDADVHLAAEAMRSVPPWLRLGPFANLCAIRRACQTYLPLADEVWVVSSKDAGRIRAQAAVKQVVVVPSGVEMGAFTEAEESAGVTAVMIANYGYGPNANGVRWLVEKVWPRVLRTMPSARLELAGGNMPAVLEKACRAAAGCTVHGRVGDLSSLYSRAAVVVAPLFEGGGTRLKIVEAWGRGKAVLTTTKGIEGLSAPEGCAVVADDPDVFARELVALFQDSAKRRRLGKQGHAFAAKHLSYSAALGIMESQSLLAAVYQ